MKIYTAYLSCLAAVLLLLTSVPIAQALTAREIMEKVDSRDDGDNMTADMKMILIDRQENKRIREMKVFTKDSELNIAAINNGKLKTHAFLRKNESIYSPKNKDIAAIIIYKDGRRQKVEFTYGGGYLSQSSRKLPLPVDAKSVIIIDSQGAETEILEVQ